MSTPLRESLSSETFMEETRHRPYRRALPVAFLAVHATLVTVASIANHSPGSRVPGTPIPGLAAIEIAVIVFIWQVFWNLRQVVTVGPGGIVIRYGPHAMAEAAFPFTDIVAVSARPVTFMDRFRRGVTAHYMRRWYLLDGQWIVEAFQSDGWTILIGTDRPEELVQAIRERMPEQPR